MTQELLIISAIIVLSSVTLLLIIINKDKRIRNLKSKISTTNEEHANTLNQKVKDYEQLISSINTKHEGEINNYKNQFDEVVMKYSPLIEKDKEIEQRQAKIDHLQQQLVALNEKYQNALQTHALLEKQIDLFNDTLEIGEYGLYQPQYSFDLPEQYKLELESIYQKQKALVALEKAVMCYIEWTVQGSKVEGRKMTKHYSKLMLYAFNGECIALIAKVKWNNISKTEERIRHAFVSINKLGLTHQIQITNEYLDLKLKELFIAYEYEQKMQEQKEEQRRIREQMREEEKAQKEYERAEREAADEERMYQRALEKVKKDLGMAGKEEMEALTQKIKLLEKNLQEAKEKRERAISLSQMTKVGHIYVISNIGSFGEDVFKIGMTRRLEPMDRVRELGDASVPFPFDVHAIIYSENAPQLEYELHKKFNKKRLNQINGRRELFKVTLDEIEASVKEFANADIEFTKIAEAKEYRETINLLERLNAVIESTPETQKFPASLLD